ncbi:MAG TPA: EAL domain-containing protein [Burkholderiales bacterium]|nr:EAL domain-containing protein [Burkholderiales bacterium]
MDQGLIQHTRPTALDKQALRLRRFSLAAASYALCLILLWVGQWMGFIHTGPALLLGSVVLAVNAGLYLTFRTNLNLRFADPSLTKAQVFLGTTVLMIALYSADVGRGATLALCFLIFLFGIFRLSTRELVLLALYACAAYALVINLLMHFRPEAITDITHEWFNWLLLAVSLPWFGVVGGRIRELRDRLRERNRELQDAVGTIAAMATRDEVTGLYNRAFFTESLNHALAQAARHERSLGVLFIDVDRFKMINDTLGHPVGDRALRELGARIAQCVRGSDLVARLGGDEFVALIESVPATDALQEVAQKIIEAVAQPLVLDRRELALSVSIGIARMPSDALDAQTLMRNADIAMYRAKAKGRNCFSFYTQQMSEHAEERLELKGDLQHAVERGELRVLYQPKVSVADGAIRGAEALLRWEHPRLGLLTPERFINLAEEGGAIVPIGRWVLREACARAAAWGGSYTIAVNLSARQFSDPALADIVQAALRESGLPPALLELEITESMVMREPDAAAATMRRLRALGVRLSMDDFGTGYSSLGYLKRFPITTVKLDRSFVRDLPHRDDDVAIARAVLAMARSLRMDVTAEGVERSDQLEFLRREGCLAYQGYFCSPPVAEAQFLALLETNGRRWPLGGDLVSTGR